MKNKEDVLTISPMTDYKVPELPTYEENKPDLASKLPSRWKSKAAIAAVSGILGASALTGCTLFEREASSSSNNFQLSDCGEEDWWGTLSNFQYDLCIRSHHGGFVGPSYVAHLTEQEVFGIISSRLEAVELNFNDSSPEYIVDIWRPYSEEGIAIDLFNSEHNVGIVHASWLESYQPFYAHGRAFSSVVAEAFVEQVPNLTVGVFNTPGQNLGFEDSLNASNAAEIRSELLEDLDEQIQEFIDQLQEEGIID